MSVVDRIREFRYVVSARQLPWTFIRTVDVAKLRVQAPDLQLVKTAISAVSDCRVMADDVRSASVAEVVQLTAVMQVSIQFLLHAQSVLKSQLTDHQREEQVQRVAAKQLERLEAKWKAATGEAAMLAKEKQFLMEATHDLERQLSAANASVKQLSAALELERSGSCRGDPVPTHGTSDPVGVEMAASRGTVRSPSRAVVADRAATHSSPSRELTHAVPVAPQRSASVGEPGFGPLASFPSPTPPLPCTTTEKKSGAPSVAAVHKVLKNQGMKTRPGMPQSGERLCGDDESLATRTSASSHLRSDEDSSVERGQRFATLLSHEARRRRHSRSNRKSDGDCYVDWRSLATLLASHGCGALGSVLVPPALHHVGHTTSADVATAPPSSAVAPPAIAAPSDTALAVADIADCSAALKEATDALREVGARMQLSAQKLEECVASEVRHLHQASATADRTTTNALLELAQRADESNRVCKASFDSLGAEVRLVVDAVKALGKAPQALPSSPPPTGAPARRRSVSIDALPANEAAQSGSAAAADDWARRYDEFPCVHCRQRFRRSALSNHEESCELRMVKCSTCGASIVARLLPRHECRQREAKTCESSGTLGQVPPKGSWTPAQQVAAAKAVLSASSESIGSDDSSSSAGRIGFSGGSSILSPREEQKAPALKEWKSPSSALLAATQSELQRLLEEEAASELAKSLQDEHR